MEEITIYRKGDGNNYYYISCMHGVYIYDVLPASVGVHIYMSVGVRWYD